MLLAAMKHGFIHNTIKILALLLFTSATGTVYADTGTYSGGNTGNNTNTPKERIEDMATRLFAKLKAGAPAADATKTSSHFGSKFEADVYAILAEMVDFKSITRGVMGKHKKSLNEAQALAFQQEFEKSIVQTLTGVFSGLSNYTLTVKAAKMKNEKKAQVPVEITTSDAEKYEILFSLSRKQDWRVRNLIVNGINLGITYRNQFNESMKSNGKNIDAVIKGWSKTSDE